MFIRSGCKRVWPSGKTSRLFTPKLLMYETEGEAEAIILVKASPHVSQKYGETVCCAGVTLAGEWVRLYPVTFRRLDDAKKFKRWDHIRFKWRAPKDDRRPES